MSAVNRNQGFARYCQFCGSVHVLAWWDRTAPHGSTARSARVPDESKNMECVLDDARGRHPSPMGSKVGENCPALGCAGPRVAPPGMRRPRAPHSWLGAALVAVGVVRLERLPRHGRATCLRGSGRGGRGRLRFCPPPASPSSPAVRSPPAAEARFASGLSGSAAGRDRVLAPRLPPNVGYSAGTGRRQAEVLGACEDRKPSPAVRADRPSARR